MQGEYEQERARLAQRLSRENCDLMARLRDLEGQHVGLSLHLSEAETRQRWAPPLLMYTAASHARPQHAEHMPCDPLRHIGYTRDQD